MAKALVEVIGDSASAVRALEQTSVALTTTGDAAKKAAVDMDAYAASAAKAQATRAETLLAQSASLKQLSASSAAGSTEQMAANEAALKRQTQAYKLLGLQAATTRASVTQTAGTIGRGLTTYVTAPAAFIGYEAVKQAMNYQQALLLIRTQAGASEAELQRMNAAVLQLAQSGHSYGQTAQEMAQGLYYVESEGIRGGRALAILQAAAAGAAKGQTSMVDTTNALTSAMKIWNVSASGAATTMATIDAITATGKMHLEDLNNAFQTKFFTTAKQLGIPLEQAGAALDVFTKAGVPAEVAANNMTTSFIKMVTPAKAALPYLQQLGLSANSLGQDLQSGGLSKALGELAAGYEHLVQTQGKFQANRAVLESFGGSRSGAPALALVQQYATYLQSLGQIQRLNNPATFWSQVSEAMNQPAMKMKVDLAEISADFIKLGVALEPAVTAIASGVTTITNDFQKLPGPVKQDLGVIVALLAVGGPLGLAVKGVGDLLGGLGRAFKVLGPSAATGVAEADVAMTGLQTSVGTAETKVGTLRGALIGLGELGPISIPVTIAVTESITQEIHGFRTDGIRGAIDAVANSIVTKTIEKGFGPIGQVVGDTFKGAEYLMHHHDRHGQSQGAGSGLQPPPFGLNHVLPHRHHRLGPGPTGTPPPTPPPPITKLVLPQKLQLELAKAQAGFGSITKAQEDERTYILRMIRSGRLTGAALVQAYQALASLGVKATADVHKAQAAFLQHVHNDQALAQARLDLANGEYSAAQSLLKKDQQRLTLLLSEAKTSEERTAVLKQLAEVQKLRHSKADQFQLSPRLQEEIAKADAQAVLNPQGLQERQVALAKRARAAAMKAINSHTLTMQGLEQAWQIVGQENQVIAGALGLANSYHAISTAALTKGLNLSHTADLTLRERLAQAEAHRGFAPNAPTSGFGSGQTHHHHHVHVELKGDAAKFFAASERQRRNMHQRAGGRR